MRVSFDPLASDEIEGAQRWYEERNVLAATGYLQELTRAVIPVADAPLRYPVALHGTRRMLLERFPFSLYYRATENEVVIVAGAHQKQRPGYWAGR